MKPGEPAEVFEPVGCPACENMGYKGRIGVYEIMELNNEIKHIISKSGTAEEIKDAAVRNGMRTLRMSASELVLEGTTSFPEMLKVSFDE